MTATPTTTTPHLDAPLAACACCGLVMRIAHAPIGFRSRCPRCHAPVKRPSERAGNNGPAAAFALGALILYPVAMALPVLRIERLGQATDATIWSGVVELVREGSVFVGAVVFLSSIVIPLFKILAIFALAAGDQLLHRRHRAITYRFIEWIGRWGMIDVLLVAILVAAVKLGAWADISPGPGVWAFTGVVLLSLLAGAVFDPRAIWADTDA